MARNRQRAKQRQAERRARRLGEQGAGAAPGGDGAPDLPGDGAEHLLDDPTTVDPSPAVSPELAVGAPPTDEGRSDTVIEDEPDLEDAAGAEDEALEDIEDWEAEDEEATGAGEAGYAVRGRRAREDAAAHRDRPRVVQFLIAVWAELQRVQWPNRQALVTLTGVVLGFVLIAGGYLGLLDAIFSELIQAIL
jgi:preprotein translocase SecE subunit